MNPRQILAVAQALLLVLYAPTAYAATVAFGSTFTEMPLAAWGTLFLLSTIAGVSTLLAKLREELIAHDRAGEPLRWPGLFIASHLMFSWLGGLFALVLSLLASTSDLVAIADVIVGSWLGVKFLQRVAEQWSPPATRPAPAAEAAP